MFNAIRIIQCLGLAVFIGGCAGCSEKNAWEETYPAQGKILWKGQPLADAELMFFPEDTKFPTTVRPRAKSSQDGSFVVWTYAQGDGAPLGGYKVTVVRNQVAVSKDAVVAKPNDLPKKFSIRETSDINVTITEGTTELPLIELR